MLQIILRNALAGVLNRTTAIPRTVAMVCCGLRSATPGFAVAVTELPHVCDSKPIHARDDGGMTESVIQSDAGAASPGRLDRRLRP
jgi:hypothetical protein